MTSQKIDGERDTWNQRYRAGDHGPAEPDPLLLQIAARLPRGAALDLAGGTGRHALALAVMGFDAVLADISEAGLEVARARAAQRELALTYRCEAAEETVRWAQESGMSFQLICVFWFLERKLLDSLPLLLSPGGVLVYKTFTAEHARFTGRVLADWVLAAQELGDAFPALVTMVDEEADGVAAYVGRRP